MNQQDILFVNEEAHRVGHELLAGVDEAGRGPLAGPLVVAAVILDPRNAPRGVNDSKKLAPPKREILYRQIIDTAIAWRVAVCPVAEIDRLNILQATMAFMREAVRTLAIEPDFCIVDGNRFPPDMPCAGLAIPKADGLFASVAAASILAKVTRDRIMNELHTLYPEYGFDRHKGYPTAEHLAAINAHGLCPEHRLSYRPCAQLSLDL